MTGVDLRVGPRQILAICMAAAEAGCDSDAEFHAVSANRCGQADAGAAAVVLAGLGGGIGLRIKQ